MYRLGANDALLPVLAPSQATRRQDLPDVYVLNGAIYIAEAAWLRQTRAFPTNDTVAHVLPLERALDIDSAADFEVFKRSVVDNVNG